ncbi:MAG TPA: hypothetical protein PK441_01215 [Burkholderiaceae bacterium]|nr:hypothetical protein [Burkholderiaceae bacterium]
MATAEEIWLQPVGGTPASDVLPAARVLARDLHHVHGLQSGQPLVVSPTTRQSADVDQALAEAAGVTTVTRNP